MLGSKDKSDSWRAHQNIGTQRTSVRVLIDSNVNIRWHWKRDTTASHELYRKAQYVVLAALFVPHINASLSRIRHWPRKCIDGLVRGKDDQWRVAIRPRRKTRCTRQSQRETVAYHARTSLLRYKTTKNNRKRIIYVQGTFCTRDLRNNFWPLLLKLGEEWLKHKDELSMTDHDFLATLTELTAVSITKAYKTWCPGHLERVSFSYIPDLRNGLWLNTMALGHNSRRR